jgi:formylmethanofuran dehydrogenase subunit A
LSEIAIMTRAGPARLLGLKDRGHLGDGAAADIAVYPQAADAEATFSTPRWVLKDGAVVARDGKVCATPAGGVHFATTKFDDSITRVIDEHTTPHLRGHKRYQVIGHDELCACCNGAKLLPQATEWRDT